MKEALLHPLLSMQTGRLCEDCMSVQAYFKPRCLCISYGPFMHVAVDTGCVVVKFNLQHMGCVATKRPKFNCASASMQPDVLCFMDSLGLVDSSCNQ